MYADRQPMLDHAKLPVVDLDVTRAFYSAALAPFGCRVVWDTAPTLGFGTGDGIDDDEPIAFELARGPIARCHIAFARAAEPRRGGRRIPRCRANRWRNRQWSSRRPFVRPAILREPLCSILTDTTSRRSTKATDRPNDQKGHVPEVHEAKLATPAPVFANVPRQHAPGC